jgi:hypothetical protein
MPYQFAENHKSVALALAIAFGPRGGRKRVSIRRWLRCVLT